MENTLMKNFTKYAYGIIGFTLVAFMILLNGCTSPDTTTGKLAYQSKDYTKAEEYLERGLSLDKEDAEGWYMLGYSQVELGLQMNDYKKIDKAETSFQNCQTRISLHNLKGQLYRLNLAHPLFLNRKLFALRSLAPKILKFSLK